VDTINYEIVTRFGSARVPRVYTGQSTEPASPPAEQASNPAEPA